jgi:hypothetical protein
MRKTVVKMVLRICGLLAVAGLLTINGIAGSGPVPDPNGPDDVIAGK